MIHKPTNKQVMDAYGQSYKLMQEGKRFDDEQRKKDSLCKPKQVLNNEQQTNAELSPPAIANTFVGSCGSPNMRPILFNTDMVKAILEGRKTQTRRILKQQLPIGTIWHQLYDSELIYRIVNSKAVHTLCKCPYAVGDILWARETWKPKRFAGFTLDGFDYKADHVTWLQKNGQEFSKGSGCETGEVWKSSIFMPKDVARIFLKITKIKVEQLFNMNDDDAIAEGIELIGGKIDDAPVFRNYKLPKGHNVNDGYGYPTNSFRSLWNKINKSWNSNLWVWVIEFERTERPEGFC